MDLGSVLSSVSSRLFGSEKSSGSQKEKNNASVSQDAGNPQSNITPAKRSAPSFQELNRSHERVREVDSVRRVRPKFSISDEEKRLVAGIQYPTPHAVPISVPKNEWITRRDPSHSSQMTGKRKPGTGGPRPTNTLNKSSAFQSTRPNLPLLKPATLSTALSTGDNVPGHRRSPYFAEDGPVVKRQKLKQTNNSTPQFNHLPSDDSFFDREIDIDHHSRKHSTTTIESQESAKLTPPDFFSPKEARSIDRILGPQRKGRKAKTGSSASGSQVDRMEVEEIPDPRQSSHTAPKEMPPSILIEPSPKRDRDIELQVTVEQPTANRKPPGQRGERRPLPRTLSPTPPLAIQVPSAFDVLHSKQARSLPRTTHPSNRPRTAPQNGQATSPRLSQMFRRDEAPHGSRSNLRDRMQVTSDSRNTAEGSEDELALNCTKKKPRAVKHIPHRSPSPSDIKPTFINRLTPAKPRPRTEVVEESEDEYTAKESVTFRLDSIHTLSVDSSDNVTLTFLKPKRAFKVMSGDKPVLGADPSGRYLLTSKHAQFAMISDEGSLRLSISGAKDDVVGSMIWFSFLNRHDLEKCLKIIMYMTADRLKVKHMTDTAIESAFASSLSNFEFEQRRIKNSHSQIASGDPEFVTMANRQKQTAETLERTKGKRRDDLSSPPSTIHVPPSIPRRKAMKSESTDQASFPDLRNLPPAGTSIVSSLTPTRSSRRLQSKDEVQVQQESEPDRWTRRNPPLCWESPLVYPATGPKRTTIEAQDIERLDDGEFLNDNIISFCLRHLEENNPQLKDKVHIFNTFFYTSLSTKQGKRAFNYDAVKRWTKNIDIFSYPFVVVPVNVNLHWFVTIICNLDKLGRKLVDDEDGEGESSNDMLDNTIEGGGPAPPMELPDSQEDQKAEEFRADVGRMSLSDGENHDVKQADKTASTFDSIDRSSPAEEFSKPAHVAARKGKGKKRVPPPPKKINPNQPAIITLDSLGGSHSVEIRHLKDYIVEEGKEKREMSISREEIKGLLARGIPEQTNFCDCGVYLVGYITEFLKDPTDFVRKVFSRELDKNNDFADFDPARKRSEIRDELLQLEKDQKEAKRKKKKADREARQAKLAAQQQLDGTTDEPGSGRENATSRGNNASNRNSTERASEQSPEEAQTPANATVVDLDVPLPDPLVKAVQNDGELEVAQSENKNGAGNLVGTSMADLLAEMQEAAKK